MGDGASKSILLVLYQIYNLALNSVTNTRNLLVETDKLRIAAHAFGLYSCKILIKWLVLPVQMVIRNWTLILYSRKMLKTILLKKCLRLMVEFRNYD